MTTPKIYTREELIMLTDESIKRGHNALKQALQKDTQQRHSYETGSF